MLHVSCGHEKGIGVEVFLKAFLCLPARQQKKIVLHIEDNLFEQTCHFTKIAKPQTLNTQFVKTSTERPTQTLASLLSAIESLGNSDSLFTLPTSKDQLSYKGQHHLGYTEFLRAYFKEPKLTMTFQAPNVQVALLSDHVSLKDFITKVGESFTEQKLTFLINAACSYYQVQNVCIAGINPHAGENGLLGSEEIQFKQVLARVQKQCPHVKISGPFPGDTLYMKNDPQNLLVFLYHDQGLGWFKGTYGLVGANITLGLPFVRLSVDHGTAFDLYGKNMADYRGCLYALKLGLKE